MKDSYESLLSFKLKLYKYLYQEEIEYRNKVSNKIPAMVTICIAYFPGIAWMLLRWFSRYNSCSNKFLLYFSIFFIFICLGIGIYTILLFIKASINYSCKKIDPIKTKELIELHNKCLNDYSEEEIIENIEKELCKAYIESAIHNSIETNKRVEAVNKLYKWTITGILVNILCFIFILWI